MHERLAEITGLTCRWCLLVLCAAAALGGAYVELRSAQSLAAGPRADVAPTDALCGQWAGEIRLTLHHEDSPAGRGAAHVLVCLPDGTQLTDRRWREDVSVVPISTARAGLIELETVGLPYGPVAFKRSRPVVLVVPGDGREVLIDGRLVLPAGGPEAAAWRLCTRRIARGGRIAFFLVASLETYRAARVSLRRTFPGVPVEYAGATDSTALSRLRSTAWALNPRRVRGRRKPTVITGRWALAVLAAGKHFPVHMVGSAGAAIKHEEWLTRHASLGAFSQWLADQATSPGTDP